MGGASAVIDEQDVLALEHRFDSRYKKIEDCNNDMNDVIRDYSELVADIAAIKNGQEHLVWLTRTCLGAVLTGIIGAVLLVIRG
jgi:hypothetical protein